jgi:superfamily II DNA/RNA helicase
MQTLAYLLPAMTLALRRAEATYRRQQAAAAAGAYTLAEQDQYSVQVLVVAPSQELAMQICRVASGLLPPEGRSAVQQAIGGANLRRQAEALAEKQPLVVAGTPGRLADLMR